MTFRPKRAFTLIELLVVIVIIALLITMMVPIVRDVIRNMHIAHCQMNLKYIFEAHSTWRAAYRRSHFAVGPAWPTMVLPYLEDKQEPLICPEAGNPWGSYAPTLQLKDIIFEIYRGWGNFLYDIPLDSDFIFVGPGVDNPESEGWQEYQIEDQQTGGDFRTDHRDICVEIQWVGGVPVQIYFSPHHSGHGYRFKFKIKDEIIFENYDSGDSSMIGTYMDLSEYGTAVSDYGMSVGCYDVIGGDVGAPDPKLYFMLDYPKTVADYMSPVGGDVWGQFFVVAPQENPILGPYPWTPPKGYEEWTWDQVTALRHAGDKANVMFCDGHVELLGIYPSDEQEQGDKLLRPGNYHWRYGEEPAEEL